ncbi:hypothetical protein EDD36DRAFT_6669 [Exophiala viscosa]|uniref:Uncharacterized protein n=1 Tax=Exophiala viscosa TaxID=2486360 RepID=A0AAN6E3S7_9EURO|nr:hypothetical protein EDD36DRAFT_6669 [Exophiala viscosa]
MRSSQTKISPISKRLSLETLAALSPLAILGLRTVNSASSRGSPVRFKPTAKEGFSSHSSYQILLDSTFILPPRQRCFHWICCLMIQLQHEDLRSCGHPLNYFTRDYLRDGHDDHGSILIFMQGNTIHASNSLRDQHIHVFLWTGAINGNDGSR